MLNSFQHLLPEIIKQEILKQVQDNRIDLCREYIETLLNKAQTVQVSDTTMLSRYKKV